MPAIDPPVPRPALRSRFDDAAMERLESLLYEECVPHGGLSLEASDGLFSCALVSPGEPFALEELLPLVCGQPPVPVSEELHRLIAMLWEWVGQRIVRAPIEDPSRSAPLMGMPDPDEEGQAAEDDEALLPVGSVWALGFMLGYELRADAWEARLEGDENASWDIVDILSLAPELDDIPDDGDAPEEVLPDDGGDEVPGEAPTSLTMEERLDVIASLPAILADFHAQTIEERTPRVPARRGEIPARNDPCPCGSGLKFKKCHGDPSRLN